MCIYIIRQLIFKKRDCTDPVLRSSMKGYMTGFELSKMLQDEDNVDYSGGDPYDITRANGYSYVIL